MIKLIYNKSLDPYFNIACEEHLFRNSDENIIHIWRSKDSVIIGKHQNALSEINYSFTNINKIPVIRRISGGGTVFHDPGNINFSFIYNFENSKPFNFAAFNNPVIEFLKTSGLNPEQGKRNAIYINGLKVSGNGQHIVKNRILYHGTLLFSANIDYISSSLKNNTQRYIDKAVKSVPDRVGNISSMLNKKMHTEQFMDLFSDYLKKYFKDVIQINLNENDFEKINKLVETKYSLWEWNFGYAPAYVFKNSFFLGETNVNLTITIQKGLITHIDILDEKGNTVCYGFEEKLIGKPHRYDVVRDILIYYNPKWICEVDVLCVNFF